MTNPMQEVKVEKVTLNVGAGAKPDDVKKAIKLLETMSGGKPVQTYSKKRIPTWDIRPGLPIGAKITLRKGTVELLKRFLQAVDNKLKSSQFTQNGFSFGIKEYIDIPDTRYDPALGMLGFEVCVTLRRPGKQIVSKEDSIKYAETKLGVEIE